MEQVKYCRWCDTEKPITEFYVHKQMADGHLNKCKSCVKDAVLIHRGKNLERIREYDRTRGDLPHRVAARKVYARSQAGRDASTRNARISRKKYPEKYAARMAVGNGVRDGILIRPNACERCATVGAVEGHHADYDKPLEVEWLCNGCHREEHL